MGYYRSSRYGNEDMQYAKIPPEMREYWEKMLHKKAKDERFDRFTQEVTELPFKELCAGKLFYEQSWVNVKGYPMNGANGYEFMGGENAVYCMVAQDKKGYKEPVWIQQSEIGRENAKRNKEMAKTGVRIPLIFVAEKDDVVYLSKYFKDGQETKKVAMYNIEQLVNAPVVQHAPEVYPYITNEREEKLDAFLKKLVTDLNVKIRHGKYYSESEFDFKTNVLKMPPKEKYSEKEAYYCGAFFELAKYIVKQKNDMGNSDNLSAEISTILMCHKHGIHVNLDEKKLCLKTAAKEVIPVIKKNKAWYSGILRDGGLATDHLLNQDNSSMRKRDITKSVSSKELMDLSVDKPKKRGGSRHV